MDNFSDEDITLFVQSYNNHKMENTFVSNKIPIWCEYLKTKKYYRENRIDEDYYFKKRFDISQDDLKMIHQMIYRIKTGRGLEKSPKTNVQFYHPSQTSSNNYGSFNEQQDYSQNAGKFELLNELEGAMYDYHKKMKDRSNKNDWKKKMKERSWNSLNNEREYISSQDKFQTHSWDPVGSVANEPDRYYTQDQYSQRPQVEFDVQQFNKTQMFNMGKQNIINDFNKMNNILNDNELITNDFDEEYKRAVPQLCPKKKVHFNNNVDYNTYNKNDESLESTRLWQDMDILDARGNTRNSAIPNKSAFEHQFQYLDGNYNRVADPRILGTSSRTENKTPFTRK